MTGQPALARRLGTSDAVVVGLSAMLGAGVFVVFAPAASAAGGALPVALAVAAVVAFCNATASAQLASTYPSSGGTYLFGREVLGPWWGFLAGWGFVVGKTASCAAMAMTFAAYAVPADVPGAGWWQRGAALLAVGLLTLANLRGVTRTAAVARILLVLVADLRGAIGFSSVGVLVYYAVANAAALRQPAEQRQWPRALHVLGLLGCVVLVVTLPSVSVVAGLIVLALGLVGRATARRRRGAGAR